MNGSRALSGEQWPGCRVRAGARHLLKSMCASYGSSPRESSAGGAPFLPVGSSAPNSILNGRVSRALRISLRGKLAGDPAQDEANRLPSVSINLLRHALNMTEPAWLILRIPIPRNAENAA
jgi:hypothetical protein